MKIMKRLGTTLCIVCLCITMFASCSTKNEIPADVTSNSEDTASSSAETANSKALIEDDASSAKSVSTVLDQYYANDKFMIEMLVNEDVIITENDGNLVFTTKEDHAGIVISMIPGVQNLTAAGELCKSAVLNAFPGAQTGEVEDAYLFAARAKLLEYAVPDEDNPFMGIEATAIVNQSCYFMNSMFYEGISEAEGKLIVDMFSTINVLRPTNVDSGTQKAEYRSAYAEQLKTQQVKPAKQTKVQSVEEWIYLPYYYYSWYSDPGDSFDAWYYEPDWDYYSDSGDYWSWGWDDNEDWGFYDEYGDYYAWDTYQEYQDYYDDWDGGGGYGDDYAEYYDWALESNDYEWSDPGDGNDEWSDPGDYYDDGYDEGYDEGAWSDEEYYESNDYDW